MKSFLSLLFITVSVIVFFMFVRPDYAALQVMRQEVATEKANLETASQLVQSRDSLMATYQSISNTDLTNIKTLLPDSVDNIRLIIQINSLATKNGLSLLRSVDYQTDQDATTVDASQNPGADQRPYGEFTISFQTTGQYKNFLAFLSDLEQNLRLVDVTNVEFVPTVSATPQSAASGLSYKVTLRTYWLKQ